MYLKYKLFGGNDPKLLYIEKLKKFINKLTKIKTELNKINIYNNNSFKKIKIFSKLLKLNEKFVTIVNKGKELEDFYKKTMFSIDFIEKKLKPQWNEYNKICEYIDNKIHYIISFYKKNI